MAYPCADPHERVLRIIRSSVPFWKSSESAMRFSPLEVLLVDIKNF
jgi:hypothetical protein